MCYFYISIIILIIPFLAPASFPTEYTTGAPLRPFCPARWALPLFFFKRFGPLAPRYLFPSRERGPKPWGRSSSRAAAWKSVPPGSQHPQPGRKLVQHLPAASAGPAVVPAPPRDGNGGPVVPVALADRLQQGGTLGTDRGAKGGVLHIAAGKYSAVPAQQSGSHRKAGIGCIRKSMHGKRACYQLLVCHICFLLIVGPDLTPDALFPLLYPARPFRTRSTVQLDSAFPDSSVHFLQNQCKYILY